MSGPQPHHPVHPARPPPQGRRGIDLEDVRTVLEHETMTTRRAGGSAEVHDGMPDSYAPSSAPTVYQLLRLVLRGINPMTWRRLLVSAESTVADLHDILQLGFGWSGSISTGS